MRVEKAELSKHYQAARARLLEEYRKLSPVLKGSVLASAAFLAVFVIFAIVEPIYKLLEDQALALEQLDTTVEELGPKLESYARLKARREAIEERYKEVEIREGALSYLERLLSTKGDVPAGQFTIRELPSKEFGGNFVQTTYSIEFKTNNMKALTELLDELVHGKHPLILGKLELAMSARSDALEVELDVTTIKRVSQEA